MSEAPETRLRRLRMRSWRRGMKETDLVLGRFADARLADLDAEALDRYEQLLSENDQDILAWITGAAETPGEHARMLTEIRRFAELGPKVQT